MAITQNTFTTANSTTTEFDFTFPYLEQDDVKVRVDGTDTTAFTFVNATRIKLNTAPASGKKVIVYRNTSNDIKKASFYPGSAIKAEDLNSNADQLLYSVQEIDNNALSSLGEGELKQSDVGIASDFGVKFEGATTDGNFTTLKAKAQTTNRVIRLPDAAGTLVVSALDDNTIQTANIANDAIDSTKLADNAVNSEHYVDGSIDLAHMSANSIDSDQYVDGSIDHAHLSGDCIDGDNIQDNCINSEHYVDYSIDHVHLAADCVDGDNIADNSIGAEHIERLDNHLLFGDDKYAKFGASDDFVIGHSSSDNYSYIQETNTGGGLRIKAEDLLLEDTSGDNYLYAIHDGAVKLYYDNSEKLATTSTGVSIAGNSSINGSLDLGGGVFIGGSDHYIYQDSADRLIFRVGPSGGTHTYGSMAVRSGVFTLGSASGDVHIEVGNEDPPETSAKFINNGAVELYHNNGKRAETTSAGFKVNGIDDGDNFIVDVGTGTGFVIHQDHSDGEVAVKAIDRSGNNYAKYMTFWNHPASAACAEAMRIDSNLCLLVGETSSYADGTMGRGILQWGGKNGQRTGAQANQNSTNQTAAIGFSNPNGHCGSIDTSGTSTIYNTSSDYRLKENQVAISDGITRLKNLKPYRFNFKKTPNETVDGFFAHEVQAVVPQAVTGTKDATKDILYDANDSQKGNIPSGKSIGDVKETVPVIQGLDPSKLVPLLTAALQEAIAKIEVLETEVATLKG